MRNIITSLILGMALLCACSESDEPNEIFEIDLTEITSHTENEVTITLYAQEKFFVGYNSITAKIEDADGNQLSGSVEVTPMMDMITMQHSSPIEAPDSDQINDGRFEFNTVFVMPTSEMGSWSLEFTVNGSSLSIPVEVEQPEYARLVSFTSELDDTTTYFVAMIQPDDPTVGQNDIEIAVFKKESMMAWPPVTDLTLEMEPWMVSMDHGSPNNVAPVHSADGHYIGIVNFTMTGDWQIRFEVMQSAQLCGEPYFDLMFQ